MAAVAAKGGILSLSDLSSHTSTFDAPISSAYRGVTVWEVPPPTAGTAALIALNIVEAAADLKTVPLGSVDHVHLLIEGMRRGFADALAYVGDQAHVAVPLDVLLSKEYAKERASGVTLEKATEVGPGSVAFGSMAADAGGGGEDTVYFCAVDGEGNACSMINSNYM